jgi:hypothetical protein
MIEGPGDRPGSIFDLPTIASSSVLELMFTAPVNIRLIELDDKDDRQASRLAQSLLQWTSAVSLSDLTMIQACVEHLFVLRRAKVSRPDQRFHRSFVFILRSIVARLS